MSDELETPDTTPDEPGVQKVTEKREWKEPRKKGSPNGSKAIEDEAIKALFELAGSGGELYVKRLGPVTWNGLRVKVGDLARTLTAEDLRTNAHHQILGGGEYRIGRGDKWQPVKIPGTPTDFEEVQPFGGQPFPQGFMPPGYMGQQPPWWFGQPQQQNVAADVAKAVAEALRPVLEVLNKRDEKASASSAIEIERIRLEAAKEDRIARVAEANATRAIGEAKAQKDYDAELARIKAQADYNKEMAQAMLAAKDKEGTFLDKLSTLKDIFGPGEKEGDMWDEFDKMTRVMDRLQGRIGEPDMFRTIMQNLDKLPQVLQALRPQQPGAPTQPGQPPVQPNPQQAQQEIALITEFMSAIRTLHEAISKGSDPVGIASGFRVHFPNVTAFAKQASEQQLFEQMAKVETHGNLPAADKQVLAEFKNIAAANAAWLGEFFKAVRKA